MSNVNMESVIFILESFELYMSLLWESVTLYILTDLSMQIRE